MAWQTPKQNWTAADGVTMDDMNRIEGNNQANKDNIASLQQNLTAHKSETAAHNGFVGEMKTLPLDCSSLRDMPVGVYSYVYSTPLSIEPIQTSGARRVYVIVRLYGGIKYIIWMYTGGAGEGEAFINTDSGWKRLLNQDDYDQLFQYANDGKTGIANAVTAKGVAASPTDTFATLAGKIGQISTGKRIATASVTAFKSYDNYHVVINGLIFTPSHVIAHIDIPEGLVCSEAGAGGCLQYGSYGIFNLTSTAYDIGPDDDNNWIASIKFVNVTFSYGSASFDISVIIRNSSTGTWGWSDPAGRVIDCLLIE